MLLPEASDHGVTPEIALSSRAGLVGLALSVGGRSLTALSVRRQQS